MIDESTSGSPSHLTAAQAAAALGVKRATLYAYVSRGMIRSEPAAGGRRRLYARDDVVRLVRRKQQRLDPARTAAASLDWGTPVIDSAITSIADGRLYYRGHDAVELAATARLEEVAALLWTGDRHAADRLFGELPPPFPEVEAQLRRLARLDPIERCQAILPIAAAEDPSAWDLRPAAAALTGARILRVLASAAAGADAPEPGQPTAAAESPIAGRLAAGWALADDDAMDAVRQALVLCADHELNVSAFTARCVASAGASLYDAVGAGLAALKGTRHGGATRRFAALLAEAGTPEGAARAVAERLRRGEPVPGFGHRLYPAGDPRAAVLLTRARQLAPPGTSRPGELATLDAVVTAAAELLGESPSLDVGLVALALALRLPAEAPLVLFALGRSLGWIGHALEEYGRGTLIRPRARYVGEPPRSAR